MRDRLEAIWIFLKVFVWTIWKSWTPVLLWLALGWYFNIETQTILLGFIAVSVTGIGVYLTMSLKPTIDPITGAVEPPMRDFYVVIDTNYKRNILENGWHNAKPYTLDSVYAFESFRAAKAMYVGVSKEHYPFDERYPWVQYPELYMDGSAYEEYEARLWVVPAVSKQEAHDKALYHDSRRLLGGSGNSYHDSHLVFVTDNEKRRADYKAWWHLRMGYVRYLTKRKQALIDHPDVKPACWELNFEEWCNPDGISDGKGKRERYRPGCGADDPTANGWYEDWGHDPVAGYDG